MDGWKSNFDGVCESQLKIRDNDFNITGSSGCDMDMTESFDVSLECRSPSPSFTVPMPRKLNFNSEIEIASSSTPISSGTNRANVTFSPPYKKVRALRLFDSPATPKTLLEKCSSINASRARLFGENVPRAVPCKLEKPLANVNPFTPDNYLNNTKKRTRSIRSVDSPIQITATTRCDIESDNSDYEIEQPTKRLALQENNISRYHEEFVEVELIGTGEFGSVYKCINRLDGCVYAIKKSLKPVAGSVNEKTALNEVYAHAVLGKHQHVVRYYSAWAEDDHMIIQNEFCNGGSLADAIAEHERAGTRFTETELRRLLHHLVEGLRYIHSMQLVHMDMKPANVFVSKEMRTHSLLCYDSADDGFDELDESLSSTEEEITYKIGDLGHVTSTTNPQVEEGDSRYLPKEILQEDYTHLTKADIFALGLTMYEAAGSGPLPKNGELWHEIREGHLKELPYSRDFNDLLKQMIDPNPELRPSALCIMQHRYLCPFGNKTKAQLRRELNAEKLKNEILSKQLMEAAKCLKTFAPNILNQNHSESNNNNNNINNNNSTTSTRQLRSSTNKLTSRLIGKKVNRSHSTTNF